MNTVIVTPSVKNVLQKVNEWGNANSGAIAVAGVLLGVVLLVARRR